MTEARIFPKEPFWMWHEKQWKLVIVNYWKVFFQIRTGAATYFEWIGHSGSFQDPEEYPIVSLTPPPILVI